MMERFEFDIERNLEVYDGFVSKTKDILSSLINNIKDNIKDYENKIEETNKDIDDNEQSREKCEQEITKMESNIESIKEAIENVENTYKKIADAYSTTSKGDTKELYSEIIDGAKANCEKDVEKNRSEIARLNSDIEAIKNNITEFTKIIDELNRDLDGYELELFKYNKTLEYMSKLSEKASADLDDISIKKDIIKKVDGKSTTTRKTVDTKKTTSTSTSTTAKSKETVSSTKSKTAKSVLDNIENETFTTKRETKTVSAPKMDLSFDNNIKEDDSIKQIYDMTGFQPKKEEVKETVPKTSSDNLDSLFSTPSMEINTPVNNPETTNSNNMSFLGGDFAGWENILNEPVQKEETQKTISSDTDTVNQLLNPYGTTYDRLKSLVGTTITYKNGSKVPFDMTIQDVIKAINEIDGNDLKMMKTIGPETTLLRKIKNMKEGNL